MRGLARSSRVIFTVKHSKQALWIVWMMASADSEPETEIQEGDTSSPGENTNPWPHLDPLFAFKHRKGNNVLMQCKMCLPRRTELSAFKSSTSNLRKHVVVSSLDVPLPVYPKTLYSICCLVKILI